jgi:hypothetical protein
VRVACLLATVAAWVLLAGPAAGQPGDVKLACSEAHEQGQRLRNGGKLLAARDQFVACARDGCPALVRKDCGELLSAIESEVPTILVDARDASGRDTADVRVLVDGQVVREHLDGMAFAIDPGEHSFRFETAGAAPLEQRLVVQAGDKGRHIAVAFQAMETVAALPSSPPPPRPPSVEPGPGPRQASAPSSVAYVLAGTGVAAAASFTYFAITGRVLENQRARTCSPGCTDSQLAPVRLDYLLADISLGIAALAAGGATWLFTHPSRQPPRSAQWIAPTPIAGGAMLGMGGAF